jgi:hypothetical protein
MNNSALLLFESFYLIEVIIRAIFTYKFRFELTG